jgi:hypothetical protein
MTLPPPILGMTATRLRSIRHKQCRTSELRTLQLLNGATRMVEKEYGWNSARQIRHQETNVGRNCRTGIYRDSVLSRTLSEASLALRECSEGPERLSQRIEPGIGRATSSARSENSKSPVLDREAISDFCKPTHPTDPGARVSGCYKYIGSCSWYRDVGGVEKEHGEPQARASGAIARTSSLSQPRLGFLSPRHQTDKNTPTSDGGRQPIE